MLFYPRGISLYEDFIEVNAGRVVHRDVEHKIRDDGGNDRPEETREENNHKGVGLALHREKGGPAFQDGKKERKYSNMVRAPFHKVWC